MTILSADLRFFAAEYQTDEAYGGGPMSADIVQDGVSANVFPLIGEGDAAIGRVQLRKNYVAVLSDNTDTLLNAAVHVFTPPTDPEVDVLLFKWGDSLTTRVAAADALAQFPYIAHPENFGTVSGSGTTRVFSNDGAVNVGDRIVMGFAGSGENLTQATISLVATVTAKSGSNVTFDITWDAGFGTAVNRWHTVLPAETAPRCCGVAGVAVGAGIGDTSVGLDRLEGRVIPEVTPYPSAPPGLVSTGLRPLNGLVPLFRVGELVQIRNAAGTTSELALVAGIDYYNQELVFSAPLAHAYSAGSRVSSLVQLGDLQAQAGSSFSQQTWTRVFSDTLIGNSIGANYNRTAGNIAVTNEGAETERWALVFTNATSFRLIGERLGQIASGTIDTDFSPLNPITNQPYFTIPAAGWGTGWQAGNVLRLNTVGARAPFWAVRSISPTPTETTDGAVFQIRGAY